MKTAIFVSWLAGLVSGVFFVIVWAAWTEYSKQRLARRAVMRRPSNVCVVPGCTRTYARSFGTPMCDIHLEQYSTVQKQWGLDVTK